MPYIDLHLHLGTKALLAKKRNANDCWKRYYVPDRILDRIFDSQSALDQFSGSKNWRLVCCSLHPPEKASLKFCGFRNIARTGRDEFTVARLDKLIRMPYHEVLLEEMDLIMRSLAMEKPFLVPVHRTSMDQYDPQPGVLNVLFTVEGAHAFFQVSANGSEAIEPVLERLRDFNDRYRPVAVNLCHFQTHELAAQAYAFVFRTYQPSKAVLYPSGSGIGTKGHEFIRECLDLGIMVDLKHMGLSARKDFYERYNDIPLLATHIGLTGLKWSGPLPILRRDIHDNRVERLIYRKPKGHLSKTYFNPISINFYDEDIEAILRSKGLIGLSLDQRILGASQPMFILDHVKRKEREFVSMQDRHLFQGGWSEYAVRYDEPMEVPPSELTTLDDDVELDEEGQRRRLSMLQKGRRLDNMKDHPRFLVNQVIHIARVAQEAALQWQDHVAIGSDMDGLINAVDHCTTVERFEDLEAGLKRCLKSEEVRAVINDEYDADVLTDKIMYGNALVFLQKNAFGGWKTHEAIAGC